jgi:predicted nuclease of restriction endonuclease-like RecB superfamily
MWADLPLERPVELPDGRPAEQALAAAANLDRLQRAVRRACEVELRLPGDAAPLVRAAVRSGLLVTAARGPDGDTILEIAGPLALTHDGAAYGRALAALVPLLAAHARFRLEIRTRIGDGRLARERAIRIEPPVLLPPLGPLPRRPPGLADRLARRLAAAGCAVEREPPPIPCGDRLLLFPELAVEHAGARWWIEIAAFSTDEHLARRLACYAAAGVENVVFCVDCARRRPIAPAGSIVPFHRSIDAAALLARIARPPRT